jgi:DNA-binding CsgD family transcriptional regulator
MKRRGRRPYPDILTPRQQEVLALLREGLTNEQIGQRLGISPDGAKFHVSEIIGRLGVADRHEAASWQPEGAPAGRLAALAPLRLLRKITPGWLPPAITLSAIGVAAIGVGLLAWGLVITRDHDSRTVVPPSATATPTALTGNAAVDATIGMLQRQDVDALLGLVRFTAIGCSVEQIVGSPPPCPTGTADGTPVDAFSVSQCEGYYLTGRDDVGQQFEAEFKGSGQSSVYAVLKDPDRTSGTGLAYIVAITPGTPASPTLRSLNWSCHAARAASRPGSSSSGSRTTSSGRSTTARHRQASTPTSSLRSTGPVRAASSRSSGGRPAARSGHPPASVRSSSSPRRRSGRRGLEASHASKTYDRECNCRPSAAGSRTAPSSQRRC